MNTTIKINLANAEVNRLFTRKLNENLVFYEAVMQKVTILLKRSQAAEAYSLLALQDIQERIYKLTAAFYDDIDNFEGILEKKKFINPKAIQFKHRFYPECSLDSAIATNLVELIQVYDRLLSMLKVLRSSGCFGEDNDYFNNLRRYFKAVNFLFSRIQLTPLHALPNVRLTDVIDNTLAYQLVSSLNGKIDYALLYKAMTSNLAPRLEEKIRQPLLHRLKKRLKAEETQKKELSA